MGETKTAQSQGFEFNRSIKVEARGNRLTSDGGALLLREFDERLRLTADLAEELVDPRNPIFVTHPLEELLRTRLYAIAQGHKDQNDVDRLREDPAFRVSVSSRRRTLPLEEVEGLVPNGLSSQPTQSRLIESLSLEENLAVLNAALFTWAQKDLRAANRGRARRRVLDVDSLPIQAHGSQPGSANNGYYHMRCFHPIAVFDHETGYPLAGKLRPGNVSSANGVVEFLLPIVDKVQAEGLAQHVDVRGDAGFPTEPLLAPLEERGSHYAFRLRTNSVLGRLAAPYLKRPPGRPPGPRGWTHELDYRVTSGDNPWSRSRRVVLVVLEKPGELFLEHFFLVTNWTAAERTGLEILEWYRQRGTMEGYLGEFKSVLQPALSSAPRPKAHFKGKQPKSWRVPRNAEAANKATFFLFLLSYSLLNAARRVMNRGGTRNKGPWSLDRLRTDLLKVAARVTRHSRYAVFQINEAAGRLWEVFRLGVARLQPQLC